MFIRILEVVWWFETADTLQNNISIQPVNNQLFDDAQWTQRFIID